MKTQSARAQDIEDIKALKKIKALIKIRAQKELKSRRNYSWRS
jgi:hypothetical protein